MEPGSKAKVELNLRVLDRVLTRFLPLAFKKYEEQYPGEVNAIDGFVATEVAEARELMKIVQRKAGTIGYVKKADLAADTWADMSLEDKLWFRSQNNHTVDGLPSETGRLLLQAGRKLKTIRLIAKGTITMVQGIDPLEAIRDELNRKD